MEIIKALWPLLIVQLILLAVALVDLGRREPRRVRGKKWAWAIVIVALATIGPVGYFLAGRKEA